jgi:hypothetical protein
MHEHEVSGRRHRLSPVRRAVRRRGGGPRPVRPGVSAVAVRPAEVERPVMVASSRVAVRPNGPRLLARRPAPSTPVRSTRRVVAGLVVTVAAAAVVVGLGQLAEVAAAARAAAVPAATAAPAGVVTVTVTGERTVWEVARAVAPGASGPEQAALVERIVTDNSLTSVRLQPGQVLRVTVG